nr:lamin tail domain-containing protein [Candidatus Neomarinimicrobiota bacterium]
LFFSEYAEGSSNNKYLEIYNAGEVSVDLGGYSLSSCSNGCDDGVNWDYPNNVEFTSNTMIAPGDVYVVCHGSADATISAECDQEFTYLSNGDDVFGLTTTSGDIIDIIGTIGEDIGDGWTVAGVNNGTKDHTLVRSPAVNSGNSGDWEMSAGTNASDSEWIVYDQNEWDYIGFHICSACGSGGDAPLLFIQSPSDGEILNSTDFEISFSVYNFEIGTDGYIVYSIDGNENNINNTDPIPVTGALEGEHDLTMELVDNDGNSLDPAVEVDISFSILLPTLTSIADIQNSISTYEGQTVIVQGVVTIGDDLLFPGRTKFYIQDESGRGVQVYNSDELEETYIRGDFIEVMGMVELFNDDVEITNPTITLIGTGYDLPEPYEIQGTEAVSMNGTWAITAGELSDYWHYTSGSTEFTALTITSNNGSETQTMFWNSAVPASELIQFEEMIGEELAIAGVVSFYNSAVQLTCGYFIDIQSNADPNLPVADAGDDQVVSPGDVVYLDASASFDTGTIVAYEWVQLDGPAVNIEDEESPTTSFIAPDENSIITFRLTIWDDDINEATDEVTIMISGPSTIYDIQYTEEQGDYCYESESAGLTVTTSGIVTFVKSGSNPNFFLQDPNFNEWAGIYVYNTSVNPQEGDEITLTATANEYYSFTQLIDVTSSVVTSSGNSIAPMSLSTGEIGTECSLEGEKLESMLVTVSNVTVEMIDEYNWYVNDGSGTAILDDYYFDGEFPTMDVGDSFDCITGVVTYSYSEFKIAPRNMDDFGCLNNSELLIPSQNSLSQNFPNPFNPETIIEFNINNREQVNISIYDLKGNLISNLIDNIYAPGNYSVIWNAENNNGNAVPSGLYFYQLKTSSDILTKSMLLVR